MEEVRDYMQEMIGELELPPMPYLKPEEVDVVAVLYERLHIAHDHSTVSLRIADLGKNVQACRHAIESLHTQCAVISEKQLFRFQQSMQAANKNLVQVNGAASLYKVNHAGMSYWRNNMAVCSQVFRQNSRAGTAQRVMEGITMGTLAFNILDRVTVNSLRFMFPCFMCMFQLASLMNAYHLTAFSG